MKPRILFPVFTALLTAGLVYLLDTTVFLPAPLGKLLSPQHGLWQNAEDVHMDYSGQLSLPNLKDKTDVYFDDRLVPHVFAENDHDLYFVQGYLHARFRLWQMELQVFSAAGRVSEIIGKKGIEHDRQFRRMGMGYAAEQSLKELESDTLMKNTMDAYTAGVNTYINSLKESQLPLEYKLIGYKPEPWTNLKSVLFLKYMSYDLAGHDDDFEMTNARRFFNPADFKLLYPFNQDSLDPVVPAGTEFAKPGIIPVAPVDADSAYFTNPVTVPISQEKPDRENGSNNWAVAGSKTATGAPILCCDPHLGLNLPSLWYEMQLSMPGHNAYGVSFPGAPGIIMGFNDSCSFGFTNGGRDVKDYYSVRFRDAERKEYLFDNRWVPVEFRVETIRVKDSTDIIDSVAYTVFGPVMYDRHYKSPLSSSATTGIALRWTAHDPGKELLLFYLLDRARNYDDYRAAISNLKTPGQNCVFAAKNGDIAITAQGKWPAKWKGQGDFVMPGQDSSYLWQGMIPESENPFQYNPERAFVSSANQKPADTTYPYYLGRNYPLYRGIFLNRKLTAMSGITPEDMMKLQLSDENAFADAILPLLLANINPSALTNNDRFFVDVLTQWNHVNDADSKGATVFSVFWKKFYALIYDDEFRTAPATILRPFESTLAESLLRDTAYRFIDNTETLPVESLGDMVTKALSESTPELKKIWATEKPEWAKYKSTRIRHLAQLEPLGRYNLKTGGGTNCLNAIKETHGPSWRMVVSLTETTDARGIYPGGQNGNPGSRYYDSFVDDWASGRYYKLWMMQKQQQNDSRVKWRLNFDPVAKK
jgi:penicillin amidase